VNDMKWIPAAAMPAMPAGWYWAAFPGAWVFYRPNCGTSGICHGDLEWRVTLCSSHYFGPWIPPTSPNDEEGKAPTTERINGQ
jgi:hypothetical protein